MFSPKINAARFYCSPRRVFSMSLRGVFWLVVAPAMFDHRPWLTLSEGPLHTFLHFAAWKWLALAFAKLFDHAPRHPLKEHFSRIFKLDLRNCEQNERWNQFLANCRCVGNYSTGTARWLSNLAVQLDVSVLTCSPEVLFGRCGEVSCVFLYR